MKLSELIEKGALIDEGVTTKTVEWNGHKFDVFVKNEQSAADFEFVFGVGRRREDIDVNDEAFSARRVHRFVRVGDKGEDLIPYEKAVMMKHGLLLALCQAINAVHGETAAAVDPKA